MSFFDKYSFHLEKDVDDTPPAPATNEPKVRKRLQKTSELFIPPTTESPADKPAEPPANPSPSQPVEQSKPAEPKKEGKRARLLQD